MSWSRVGVERAGLEAGRGRACAVTRPGRSGLGGRGAGGGCRCPRRVSAVMSNVWEGRGTQMSTWDSARVTEFRVVGTWDPAP